MTAGAVAVVRMMFRSERFTMARHTLAPVVLDALGRCRSEVRIVAAHARHLCARLDRALALRQRLHLAQRRNAFGAGIGKDKVANVLKKVVPGLVFVKMSSSALDGHRTFQM